MLLISSSSFLVMRAGGLFALARPRATKNRSNIQIRDSQLDQLHDKVLELKLVRRNISVF